VTVGCVVLTTGDRPDDLAAAVASVQRQRGVSTEVVVVLNTPADVPDFGSRRNDGFR
jgi:hypothetical protein